MKIELALALYYGSESYNLEACKTICEYAGMAEEWEKATLENLEDLMEKALKIGRRQRWKIRKIDGESTGEIK